MTITSSVVVISTATIAIHLTDVTYGGVEIVINFHMFQVTIMILLRQPLRMGSLPPLPK